MKKCLYCGHENTDVEANCHGCGTSLTLSNNPPISPLVRHLIISIVGVVVLLLLVLIIWPRHTMLIFAFAPFVILALVPVACVVSIFIFPNLYLRLLCLAALTIELLFLVGVDRAILPTAAKRNAIAAGYKDGHISEDYRAGVEAAVQQIRVDQHYNPFGILLFGAILIIAVLPQRSRKQPKIPNTTQEPPRKYSD